MRANDLEYNEEQRKEMERVHANDTTILEDRISLLNRMVDDQSVTIDRLQGAINNMRYDLDRLKEGC